jgi:nucleotide-binding universal stress UspA family protein
MQVRVMAGYDASPAAMAAIDAGAALLPHAHAWITHLWVPPYAGNDVRARLWAVTTDIDELVERIEREGEHEAHRLTDRGVRFARTAGWDAEPLVRRSHGGEGLRFAQLAQQMDVDLVLVGSRGLGGARAVLGSVSDMVVHHTPRPVLVVPHPLLIVEQDALAGGPVLVGWDGSAGSAAALAAADRLFPTRQLLAVSVEGQGQPDAADPPPSGAGTTTRLRVARSHGPTGRAVATALAGCASSQRAALVVVGSRGRSAAREILLGSVAMATLHHAHRPVMVVPTPAAESG